MSEIVQLPPSVVNKIAAGEVIERPASIVKELLENSLDAGATRIEVTIERGGLDRIRVVDDGCGLRGDQLPLAVASHATSKILTADDLFRVTTLGFRGEALASMAEVSRMVLRSRVSAEAAGAELLVNGGESQPVAPCGCPVGTTVEVQELFFNTPVRRKFLKTVQTEAGHVSEAFSRVALAHPQVHFTLRHNERHVYDLPPSDPWVTRLAQVFGRELGESLLWIESVEGPVRLWGYVADPAQSRSHPRMQYLFLNGRYVRDRALQHALGEAYRGLLLSGRYPICFLSIEMPPDLVDVNVHPTKLEVRFQDGGRLYSQLLATIRTRFLTTDLTARVTPPVAARWENDDRPQPAASWPGAAEEGELALAVARQTSFDIGLRHGRSEPLDRQPLPPHWPPTRAAVARVSAPTMSAVVAPLTPVAEAVRAADELPHSRPVAGLSSSSSRAVQILNRYLVAECDEGLIVIDQHALHERILFEKLRGQLAEGRLESQQLLVPEPVDLTAAEAAAVLEAREMLAEVGLTLSPFGGDTVLVTGVPALVANKMSPSALLRQVALQIQSGSQKLDARDLGGQILETMACKAAIKAGDRLSAEEVSALVAQRESVAETHHCPHGRPTSLVFTREELDRRFKRT